MYIEIFYSLDWCYLISIYFNIIVFMFITISNELLFSI